MLFYFSFYLETTPLVCLESTAKQKSGRGTGHNSSPIKIIKDVTKIMLSETFDIV